MAGPARASQFASFAFASPQPTVKVPKAPVGSASPSVVKAALPIRLTVRQAGTGGRIRSGDWFGAQVMLAGATTARELIVQLNIRDADGDTTAYQSRITLTPGAEQSLWLYGRVPITPPASISVLAYDLAENTPDSGAAQTLGKLAGRTEISLQTVLAPWIGLTAVLGRSTMGLELYSLRQAVHESLPTGHESTELVPGLQTSDLPDRWFGMASYRTLVWATSDPTVRPSNLSPTQTAALREWITRGGHLVIILPSIATDWFGPSNPIGSLMPQLSVERIERHNLAGIVPLLSGPAALNFAPAKAAGEEATPKADADPLVPLAPAAPQVSSASRFASVNFLTPDSSVPAGQSTSILADETGRSIAVRRIIGTGMVTVVGLDLSSPGVAAAVSLTPDLFWHRILGRRGELRSGDEISKLASERRGFFDQRMGVLIDGFIPGLINKTGAAALGILLSVVVFALYWLLAGPVGFTILARSGKKHLSWLLFFAMTAAFTVLAWGGASLLKPRRIDAAHFTVIDAIHGQPVMRARLWASALLTRYGNTRISLAEDVEQSQLISTLCPWEPTGSSTSVGFPDTRSYPVDGRSPTTINFPSRSTVKPIRVDWAGTLPWRLPVPLGEPEGPGIAPKLKLVEFALGRGGTSSGFGVSGQLKNELPHDLKDVYVIVSRTQQPAGVPRSARLMFRGEAFVVPEWKRGEVLDMAVVTAPPKDSREGGASRSNATSLEALFSTISPPLPSLGAEIGLRDSEIPARVVALSFFDLLQPPAWQDITTDPVYRRINWHGLDLSGFLTQPCIIIIGTMGSREAPVESPVPLRVEGDVLPTIGRTVFRWVYPLPASPPRMEVPDAPPAN